MHEISYQSFLCWESSETPHAFLDNIHFLKVRIVCKNALPILLKPQLKAGFWPKESKLVTDKCKQSTKKDWQFLNQSSDAWLGKQHTDEHNGVSQNK